MAPSLPSRMSAWASSWNYGKGVFNLMAQGSSITADVHLLRKHWVPPDWDASTSLRQTVVEKSRVHGDQLGMSFRVPYLTLTQPLSTSHAGDLDQFLWTRCLCDLLSNRWIYVTFHSPCKNTSSVSPTPQSLFSLLQPLMEFINYSTHVHHSCYLVFCEIILVSPARKLVPILHLFVPQPMEEILHMQDSQWESCFCCCHFVIRDTCALYCVRKSYKEILLRNRVLACKLILVVFVSFLANSSGFPFLCPHPL